MLAIWHLRLVYSAHLQLELWINSPILWKTLHRLWINLWNDSTDLWISLWIVWINDLILWITL